MVKTPPSYDKQSLFNAFIGIMSFQRTIWHVTLNIFLKNDPKDRQAFIQTFTRADVLYFVAPNLFKSISQACVLTVLHGIAALLELPSFNNDPSKMNLVFRRLIDDCGPNLNTPERDIIESDLRNATELAKPIQDSRNKIGAHNDLITNINIMDSHDSGNPYPLPNCTVGEVEEIMNCFVRITDGVVRHFMPGLDWHTEQIEIDKFFEVLTRGVAMRSRECGTVQVDEKK